jgi:hypothetical protein
VCVFTLLTLLPGKKNTRAKHGFCILLTREAFGCADKPAEKYCWLICCERKILLQLKKQSEKDGL